MKRINNINDYVLYLAEGTEWNESDKKAPGYWSRSITINSV